MFDIILYDDVNLRDLLDKSAKFNKKENSFSFFLFFFIKTEKKNRIKMRQKHNKKCALQVEIKGIVHPKIKIQSLSTQPHDNGRSSEVFF